MKHLKTFKIFETIGYSELTDEMWNEISDILLELKDDGFVVSQHISDVEKVSNKLCHDVVEIVVNKSSVSDFSYTEVEDVFKRLIDYLEPYGWNYSILYFPPIGKYHFIEFKCGGKDPLAKVYNPIFRSDEEDEIYKSQLEKKLKECQSFKISFYQDIDRLINISLD
jgi:hypothetical protein